MLYSTVTYYNYALNETCVKDRYYVLVENVNKNVEKNQL